MIAYKYLPAKFGIDAIENELIKVGIFGLQNDIFDCWPVIQVGDSPNENEDNELTEKTIDGMATRYGILSLCEEPDSLLLWAHYGASHKGMALGIELPEGAHPLEVDYRSCDNRRRIIRWSEIASENPYDEHPLLLEKAFSVKGKDWAYEKEYRVFVTLCLCEEKGGLYFTLLRRAEIRRVILGARCTTTAEDVRKAFRKDGKDPDLEILCAKPHPREFKMELIPERT